MPAMLPPMNSCAMSALDRRPRALAMTLRMRAW
jgi:hypothetical protein